MNYTDFKNLIQKNIYYIEVQTSIKDKEKFFKWSARKYAMFKDEVDKMDDIDLLISGMISIYLVSKSNG